MEFDEGVLSVIRGFSRPQMQFVNEWVAAQRAIDDNNMTYSEQFHADVKAKLFTDEAAKYMEVFVPYIAAAVATRRFTLVRDRWRRSRGTVGPEDWDDFKFWVQMTSEAMDERHRLHKELFLMLYGPPRYIESDDEYTDDE
jgi:hypothetical protein